MPIPVIMLTAVGPLEVLAEFQQQMQNRMRQNPEAANAIARSRVEEPIVLTKPAEAGTLNARILTALGIAPMEPAVLAQHQNVNEGREERILAAGSSRCRSRCAARPAAPRCDCWRRRRGRWR